jgi:acetoin:2,6-dichlorophenolindophenol oxidoreductase subunit alpha
MEKQVSQEVGLQLYELMVRIRRFEEAVVNLFARGKIPGFLHTYIGEEAVAAGVCANLTLEDKITSTHRGHGHMVAKGGRFDKAMAELYGKATGYNKGKGGSMHIAEPDLGMLGANAIVSAGIPIATGAALTAHYLGKDWVGVAFFGDGASNEGAFHESLNLASVWNLPVVYVCENNEFAESTPRWQHQKIKDVAVRAQAYDIPGVIVDGNDVEAVYFCAKEAVERARSGGGPTLIEAKTTRWRGHHEADNQSYRDKAEFQAALDNDAIAKWESALLARGVPQEKLDEINNRVEQELIEAIEFAERSPLPDPADARADIYTPFELEAI